jgi:glucose/arabinose dehydrogenase
LRFDTNVANEALVVSVVQQFSAMDTGASTSGFRRRVEIRGVPAGDEVVFRLAFGGPFALVDSGKSAAAAGSPGQPCVRLLAPAAATIDESSGSTPLVALPSFGPERPLVVEADYLIQLPADHFLLARQEDNPGRPVPLTVVPGYEALRLPLPTSEMPTGLAWRGDGTLAFCSLKGSVWLARDTDGDGIEDTQELFCDGLAAPYGIAAQGESLDVAHKPCLLRLTDRDGDGRADRADIVASGWGYTADYHDWSVGLPRDAQGAYYLGLPCQQDERSEAAAHLRGTVVKLEPRLSTADDPRAYSLLPLAAGLRFPMGLALNRAGDLFATDNQGNHTPFNELNQIVAGARYGFINHNEEHAGFAPPFREPAIDIPHPWTRSVNGICFLDDGPFAGHLIGCEYDTRRLVRMSLQRVGDAYQGAVYPFSSEPADGQETFEGPVVCAVAPDGDLYIGNLRDSGWGGGNNTGSIVRLRPSGKLPSGVREIRATGDGFTIGFTRPVDRESAGQPKHYAIESYRRVASSAYGSPDVDREVERIESLGVASDRLGVTLHLSRMRQGFVYEIRLSQLGPPNERFFPAEAYYTLRTIP